MRLALTMGDPAGIGPEIIIKALARLSARDGEARPSIVAIGCAEALEQAAASLGQQAPARLASEAALATSPSQSAVLALDEDQPAPALGQVSALGGRYAYRAVEQAVRLADAGLIDAIVTAPLNKEALNLAGYAYAGHTDMLADMTGVKGSVMMLAHGDFRVTHVSTHVPLARVPSLLTPQRLRHVISLTGDALRMLGIDRPRIAVAALNPHAGEGGIFGREDIEVTTPLVERLRADGLDIEGPVPGDTVFVKMRAGRYDAVVAMYHDQGHIPVKLLGFRTDPATGKWMALNGVNVTLGLPIIRTSVDHGTAFDIAGKGIASEESLVEAIDYAILLASRRDAAKAGRQQQREA